MQHCGPPSKIAGLLCSSYVRQGIAGAMIGGLYLTSHSKVHLTLSVGAQPNEPFKGLLHLRTAQHDSSTQQAAPPHHVPIYPPPLPTPATRPAPTSFKPPVPAPLPHISAVQSPANKQQQHQLVTTFHRSHSSSYLRHQARIQLQPLPSLTAPQQLIAAPKLGTVPCQLPHRPVDV